MSLKIENLDLGIQIITPPINIDERGFVTEIFRSDWLDFFDKSLPKQVNFSKSEPGVIRAWHRHNRNQTDYFMVTKGKMKICVYDVNKNSDTFGTLIEVYADGYDLKIIKVPGNFWHGTKTISSIPSKTIYSLTNIYDYENPDEERSPWNNVEMIDPVTKSPFDWNKPPHK